jgi:hypothetical protein
MMMMMMITTTKDTQNTGAVQPDLHQLVPPAPVVPELQSEDMEMLVWSENVWVKGVDLHLHTPACLACMLATSILQAPALGRNLMLESSQWAELESQ